MAYLTNQWKQKRSFDFTGGLTFRLPEKANDAERAQEFNSFLYSAVTDNPALFANFSNAEIVDVLIALDNVEPCTNVLTALYASYDLQKNHELRVWELEKRIQFFKTIDKDETLKTITGNWVSGFDTSKDKEKEFLADYLHNLQTSIFESNRAITSPYEEPKPPTGPYGSQNIWSASFYRSRNTLYYNTYEPKDERELFCTFRKDARDFQSTIAHDTDHTVQYTIAERVMQFREEQLQKTHLGNKLNDHMILWVNGNLPGGLGNELNRMILKSDEMRNFGLLMHYSVQGNYYLSQRYANGTHRPGVTFKIYETNPSENHTYDMQDDLDRFLAADPHGRTKILHELAESVNYHKNMIDVEPLPQIEDPSTYPQPALTASA